jgi:hypothetical protein
MQIIFWLILIIKMLDLGVFGGGVFIYDIRFSYRNVKNLDLASINLYIGAVFKFSTRLALNLTTSYICK